MDEDVKDKTFLQALCLGKGKNRAGAAKGIQPLCVARYSSQVASQRVCIGRATSTSRGSAPATPCAAARPAGEVKLL